MKKSFTAQAQTLLQFMARRLRTISSSRKYPPQPLRVKQAPLEKRGGTRSNRAQTTSSHLPTSSALESLKISKKVLEKVSCSATSASFIITAGFMSCLCEAAEMAGAGREKPKRDLSGRSNAMIARTLSFRV